MASIAAFGAYLPQLRLARASIAEAMGWLSPALGAQDVGRRTLAFWDEDPVTMAVEAARDCLGRAATSKQAAGFDRLIVASTTFPRAEPQNASIVHRALQLPSGCAGEDHTGSSRAALAALHRLLEQAEAGLVVGADRPVVPAGSIWQMRRGDGAAAVCTSRQPGLLNYLGGASLTTAFADRHRPAGKVSPTHWEERWVREVGYGQIVRQAIADCLARCRLEAADIDHFVLASAIPGIAKWLAGSAGLGNARIADPLAGDCGDIGNGHVLLMLAHALENMAPGECVLVAQLGEGAAALAFEAGDGVRSLRPIVGPQIDTGLEETNYLKLAVFSDTLDWEKGMRSRTAVSEALTVSHRYEDALLGFVGGRCRKTGAVQFPPSRIAADPQSNAVDTLEPVRLADLGGRLVSVTQDQLAFSRHPPSCYGLVDFVGGGRLMMDLTDADAAEAGGGDAVRFVFRIKDIDPQTSYRRYFWKARLAGAAHSSNSGNES